MCLLPLEVYKRIMRCLVLNHDFTFLGFTSYQGAICASYTGKAVVMEEYDRVLHSPSVSMHVPAVIRLKHFVKVAYQKIAYISYTKRNVHLRDNYVCAYCEIKKPSHQLGIDHVLPESRGGLATWENTVSCCHPCNSDKGDRTPAEAGMNLSRKPHRPKGFREIVRIRCGEIHDLWTKYLY